MSDTFEQRPATPRPHIGAVPIAPRSPDNLVQHKGTEGVDRRIATLAAQQLGTVTTVQVLECGLSSTTLGKRVARGWYHPTGIKGVHAVGHLVVGVHARWRAATLASRQPAFVALWASAWLHGWIRRPPRTFDLVSKRPTTKRIPGGFVHRRSLIDLADTMMIDGVPCTGRELTLLDLGEVCSSERLAALTREAGFVRPLDVDTLERLLTAHHGTRRAKGLRGALALNHIGIVGAQSSPEECFLATCRRSGLPEAAANPTLHLSGKQLRPDLFWAPHRVAVEIDGCGHARVEVQLDDFERDLAYESAGVTCIRIAPDQCHVVPPELLRRLGT